MTSRIVVRDVGTAQAESKVVGEIVEYGQEGQLPTGVIVETLGPAGSLEIVLGQHSIGLFEAAEPSDFQLARLQVDDPALMGLTDAELAFHFNGQTGSRVLVDNMRAELKALENQKSRTLVRVVLPAEEAP